MSPEAHGAYTAPTARVPRTIFQHAHIDNNALFPALITGGLTAEVFLLTPDNLNGLDLLVLWFLGVTPEATTVNVTINIGSCNELFNVHTQTVNNINITFVANEYECLDLTTTFATVLANLTSRDMIWLTVGCASENTQYCVGLELQET